MDLRRKDGIYADVIDSLREHACGIISKAYNQPTMKDLEEEQRKMRERMQAAQRKKTSSLPKNHAHAEPSEAQDVQALLKRVEVLEAENNSLRRQLSALRDQPRPQERRSEMGESERRHLFMKYSNVRRY